MASLPGPQAKMQGKQQVPKRGFRALQDLVKHGVWRRRERVADQQLPLVYPLSDYLLNPYKEPYYPHPTGNISPDDNYGGNADGHTVISTGTYFTARSQISTNQVKVLPGQLCE